MALSKVTENCPRMHCDDSVIQTVLSQLKPHHIFVDTTWITVDYVKTLGLTKSSTAVCYAGFDWENTTCIEQSLEAHRYIKEHTSGQVHIGNYNGSYYFNWCAEFIRQYPKYFFDQRYLVEPNCEYLYLCLNRKPHEHRLFILDLLQNQNLMDLGLVSTPTRALDENLIFNEPDRDPETRSRNRNHDGYSLGDPDLWNRYFVNVVTETTIHTNVLISEKTWKPIIGLRPFLILGDYKVYEKLQQLGFDTFDDIFGTWYYDPEWQNRARSIVDILQNFEKSPSKLNQLWVSLKPRLVANRQRFIDFQLENLHKINNLNL